MPQGWGRPLGVGRQLPPQLTVGQRPLGGGGGGAWRGGFGRGAREGGSRGGGGCRAPSNSWVCGPGVALFAGTSTKQNGRGQWRRTREVEDEAAPAEKTNSCNDTLAALPATPCLLPSLCGECFPGCLLPSLCDDYICVDLGLGTHGFGFGHGGGRMTFCKGNHPLTRLPKKTRKIATQQSVDCESLTPTQGATQQSMGKRNKKESKNAVQRSPLKEFGAALGPGFCSECRIFTSQQTTFV